MQFAVLEPLLDISNSGECAVGIGKIDLNMIFGSHFPRAVLRKRVARASDDAPPGCRKSLNRGMADAAACSSEQEGAARLVGVRRRHGDQNPKTLPMLKRFAFRRNHKSLQRGCVFWA